MNLPHLIAGEVEDLKLNVFPNAETEVARSLVKSSLFDYFALQFLLYLTHLVKVKRKPQGSTEAIVKAHILPTLGTIELAKLRHGKLTAWRNALAEAAPRKRTRIGKPQAYRTIDLENPDGKDQTRCDEK